MFRDFVLSLCPICHKCTFVLLPHPTHAHITQYIRRTIFFRCDLIFICRNSNKQDPTRYILLLLLLSSSCGRRPLKRQSITRDTRLRIVYYNMHCIPRYNGRKVDVSATRGHRSRSTYIHIHVYA